MKNIKFESLIDRDLSFVFENIFSDEVYREWAKVFTPGSHYTGKLILKGTVNFLDDQKNGIGGFISDVVINEEITFTYFYQIFGGLPKNLEEPIIQSFKFKYREPNTTLVSIEFHVPEDFVEPLSIIWDKGVISLKETLENL